MPHHERSHARGERRLKVLIADDSAISRRMLRLILAYIPEVVVVGAAEDGAQAVALVAELRPDLVLMDQQMPGTNGLVATRQIKTAFPSVRVIMITLHDPQALKAACAEAGAERLIPKSSLRGDLPRAIAELFPASTDLAPRMNFDPEAEIRLLNRRLSTLSKVNQAITRARTPEALFREVCGIAIEFGLYRLAWIGLHDKESHDINPVECAGEPRDLVYGVRHSSDPARDQGSPCDETIRTGRPCVIVDLLAAPALQTRRDEIERGGVRAAAVFPFRRGGEFRGVFVVYAAEPDAFAERDMALLEEVASDISLCLDRLDEESQRRRAEETLRESEERHRALFESSRDAIMTLAPPGWKFTSGNPATISMFRTGSEAAFMAAAPWQLSPQSQPDGRTSDEKAREMIETAMRKGSHYFEWRHRRLDGEEFPATVLLTRFELAGRTQLQATVRDVTAERAAEAHAKRLATAIEQAAEVVFITDAAGLIQYVNPAFEKVTGYTRAEALGQNPRFLKSGRHDADYYRRMWETLSGGEVWRGRIVNRRKDGVPYEVEATLSPVRDTSGRTVNYIALELDMTREVKLEEQLRHAQKMEAVGRLAGGVAHDFNNLLTLIHGRTELVLAQLRPDSALAEDLREVVDAAVSAAGLTRQLLTFSRRQPVQMQPQDLNEVIHRARKLVRHLVGEKIDVDLRFAGALPRISADAGMIEQIILNLAVNARDAMPDGGHLVFETALEHIDADYVRSHPESSPGPHVCLSVSDTGSGIAPDVLPHIFEPFFTTKPVGKGTGLGLATVYSIVQQHRGWIHVSSERGHGTVFRIYVPATDAPAPAPGAAPPAQQPQTGDVTILIVDDNASVRGFVRTVLERHGYRTLEAESGAEALLLWNEHGGQVDLVLTDMVMPGGMSGWELASRLWADTPLLKIVFTSGQGADSFGIESLTRGQHRFLAKPYPMGELLETVRQSLEDGGDAPAGQNPQA